MTLGSLVDGIGGWLLAARYKALGNGMAQPCADYVIWRIMECARAERKENNDG